MRLGILAFVAGISLLQGRPALPSLGWWWLSFLLFLLVPIARPPLRRLLIVAACFATGFCWAATLAQWRLADRLPAEWEGRDISVTGTILEMPSRAEYGTRFLFGVERIATPQAVVPHRLLLTWYAPKPGWKNAVPVPELHAGDRWRLTLRLKRPHGNANPHGFDYEAWLLERGIRATGYVAADPDNQRLENKTTGLGVRVEILREVVAERFRRTLENRPYGGVLLALAVGDQNAISAPQWRVFARTGVTHLISISGLHVTLVAGVFSGLIYFLWRRIPFLSLRLPARRVAVVAGMVAALAYAWLSGLSVPTLRTVWMLGTVALALWLGRTTSSSRVLALALLAVVVPDPWAVLSPGFWLSFGAVGLIFMVSAGRLGKPHWLVEWGRTQWAVTLGLTPLLLALFQQVSLVSPVANAFAIPAVSLVVTPLVLIGAVLPWDGVLLLAHQAMAWCMAPLEWLGALPEAVWQQHAPPIWAVATAVAGSLWLLLPKGFPSRWLGLPAMLPLFLVQPQGPEPGELRLAVLDVGQGLAVMAQTANHALLFDAGPRYGEDADGGNRVVVPFLRGEGISRLSGLVVSHDDIDHFGGAASVLDNLPADWMASSLPAGHVLHGMVRRSIPCLAGEVWEWDGVRFSFLHPDAATAASDASDNERGCVLRVDSAFGSALIAADIGHSTEEKLVYRQPGRLGADVLVVPHHGSRFSSSEAFVDQVHPRLAVFSAGYRNHFGHPRREVVERYRQAGAMILRTDYQGAVLVRFSRREGVEAAMWRESGAHYWQERENHLQSAETLEESRL